MGFKGKALAILAAVLCTLPASAQKSEQKDSLVRLIKAKSMELIEKGGINYRKWVDPTFLHNGTYLICDTALWNVEAKVINAEGNVKVVQEGTILTSERMDYLIDQDLVQARGGVVQLEDSKHNTLRTRHLDFNTKDSLAYFKNGASMRDSEGQIIESLDGSYDARIEVFTFRNNVNMFTDSIFIKTTMLDYESAPNKANFLAPIDFWKDGNMLSARSGWYLRPAETFFFTGDVHATSEDQEAWCDSLYFYRVPNDIFLLGQAQVQDTTRDVTALANRVYYTDSLRQIRLWDDAAVALVTKQENRVDTLYFGADTLIYRTIPKYLVNPGDSAAAVERKATILTDPVMEFRRKAAKAAAEARAKAEQEKAERERGGANVPAARSGPGRAAASKAPATPVSQPEAPLAQPKDPTVPAPDRESSDSLAVRDSLTAPTDSAVTPDSLLAPTGSLALADTLVAPSDSLAAADTLVVLPPRDSTDIGFLDAKGNVRAYRYDLQVRCDSLRYNDLDSIARFYIDPIVWNDGYRQYTADSLLALVRDQRIDRVALESNAFIITQEAPSLFDQIKGTEVLAYFDSTAALSRFDALGGSTALFFLKEKDEIGTVNKVETKMLSATFRDGDLERVFYFDSPKNDVYPLAQLKSVDRSLKGFNWRPELRPSGKQDITSLEVRPSEREAYARHSKTTFKQTDIYFPGYMAGVYKAIEEAKNKPKGGKTGATPGSAGSPEISDLRGALDRESLEMPDQVGHDGADSLNLADSVILSGSEGSLDSLAVRDSLGVVDSLGVTPGALGVTPGSDRESHESLTPAEIRAREAAARKAEQERKRQERIAAREARWAQLDSLDAAKAAAKLAKVEARKAAKQAKLLERQIRQDLADEAKLQKYIERYRKRKAREDARAAAKAAKETTNTTDNGTNTEPLPSLREGGYPEQREFRDSTVDPEAAGPAEAPLQRAE